ncbi:apolipoprotein N-acyltransferase [Paraperlucidibaca baekdonensis]|uniref:Apolipoprotein N-acyltransferase n=1 Tax=Paraperlucidibaca baekdonensis TaxID=748120 RepID=A0A3E0HA09_9GAMM|nr:apolipoprotein N-acyltransferase [Paraperlucidibaca baekdonensis]REH40484.1 apolipoprotein N-acyltransferase [Paraperlucidibaca baekdonensis]
MSRFFKLLDGLRDSPARPVIALLLGALMPLGLAPYNAWPVALLALALFAHLLDGSSARHSAKLNYLFGVGLWLHGGSWLLVSMHDYGNTSWPVSLLMLGVVALVMALLFVPGGWLYGRLKLWRLSWLALPALLVIGEWLRSWVLTGFPWLMTGYGFIDTPLAGWAPLLGIYGVSLAAGISAVALLAILRHGKAAPGAIIALALTWLVGGLLAPIQWTQINRDAPMSVSLVQGDIPQESKWALEWRDKTTAIYQELSASEWGRDLVIWPEAAIPQFAHEARDLLTELDYQALKSGSAFVTGIPYATWNGDRSSVLFYNSIMASGDGLGIYHKQQLVPIGEYIPYEQWLRGAIPFFNLPMSSFSWGPAVQGPLLVKGRTLAPFICYEIAYPSLVARLSKVDFLVTVSNDGWFGHSIGPAQHFQMVRMRAKETGRYIVRATNNGVTAIIDPQGQVIDRAPSFTRTVLRGEIYPAQGLTPWQRTGVWPVLLLSLLLVVMSGLRSRRLGKAGQ